MLDVPSDSTITETVRAQFKSSEEVPAGTIQVSTKDGVVTLSGSTTNLLAKKKATDIAQSVRGVLSVVNNVIVSASIPDPALEKAVVRALATHPVTEAWKVSASVKNGVVSLKGVADSWQERQLVEKIVMGVRGVKEINNTIIVNPDPARPDKEIEKEVAQTLKMDSRLDASQVDVEVEDGKVRLTGAVGSAMEKALALEKAHVTGVTSVSADRLEVHPEYKSFYKSTDLSPLTSEEIKTAIERALKYDPRVPEEQIEVSFVEGGTVILTGTVKNLNAKLATASDARHTAGVETVQNNINVERKVVVSPGIPTTDEAIEERVQLAILNDPYVEEATLTINVEKGVVELVGEADSRFEKKQIEEVTSEVKGVIAVDNELTVEQNGNI